MRLSLSKKSILPYVAIAFMALACVPPLIMIVFHLSYGPWENGIVYSPRLAAPILSAVFIAIYAKKKFSVLTVPFVIHAVTLLLLQSSTLWHFTWDNFYKDCFGGAQASVSFWFTVAITCLMIGSMIVFVCMTCGKLQGKSAVVVLFSATFAVLLCNIFIQEAMTDHPIILFVFRIEQWTRVFSYTAMLVLCMGLSVRPQEKEPLNTNH